MLQCSFSFVAAQLLVQMLVPTLCGADLGWIFYFGPANCRKIASEFWWRIFRPCFSRVSGHPKNLRPKFTSRTVGIPLQFHFLEPKIYSWRFSAYGGDQQMTSALQKSKCCSPTSAAQLPENCSSISGFACPKGPNLENVQFRLKCSSSLANFNSVQTRGIVKTSGFTRGVWKNRWFIKLKVFFVEFIESRRSSENQSPQKIARKVDFSEPRLFTTHLVCTLLETSISLENSNLDLHSPEKLHLSCLVPLRI